MALFIGKEPSLRVGLIEAKGKDQRSYGIPLAFGYLMSVIKQRWGREVDVFEAGTVQELLERKPHLVGITAVTSTYDKARAIAQTLKDGRDIPVIIGGQHITLLWHTMPPEFDVAVLGEGEVTFLDLVSLARNGRWNRRWLSQTPGICYREDDKVVRTEQRQQVMNLDVLPFPARRVNPSNPPEAVIMTSRGCPYKCSFCSSSRYWSSFRTFSAAYVVEEISHIRKSCRGISEIYILDDLFVGDRRRLREMVRGIRERGLHKKLSFRGFVRSNLVDEELCELLKQMNMKAVRFGAESGSDAVLSRIKGGSLNVGDNQKAVDLLHKYGFKVRAAFMVGIPGETEEDLARTFEFIKRNEDRMSVSGFYLTVPFPGTPLWQDALKKQLVTEDMDWSRLNLDFRSPDFAWDHFLYLNEEAISRARFLALLRQSGLAEVPI